MPREVITVQVGQCGNQIGGRFWDLVFREHAHVSKAAVYDASLSSFFRNVDSRGPSAVDIPIGNGQNQLRTLKARSILVDMEEGVVNSLYTGPLAELFDCGQRITDVSGCGNNWAHGHHFFGPMYRESIEEKMRQAAEQCDSLQCFLMFHSLGGGTGSGVGTYILKVMEDVFPEVFRFVCCVCPSKDDDVITSPYNTTLALKCLIDSAHCVLPVSNDALLGICNLISTHDSSRATQATLTDLPQDFARVGGSARNRTAASAPPGRRPTPDSGASSHAPAIGVERPFDRMNTLVAHMLNNLTSSMRFEGSLNLDLNEITMNLVPFPRMHFLLSSMSPLYFAKDPRLVSRGFHQTFSDVLGVHNQLMNADPRGSTYMAMAFLVRGSASISDVTRSVARVRKQVKMLPYNDDAFKIGLCSVPPKGLPFSVLGLANSCAAHQLLGQNLRDFSRLYQRKAHVHHYTEYMEKEAFDEAFETVNTLMKDYINLDMLHEAPRPRHPSNANAGSSLQSLLFAPSAAATRDALSSGVDEVAKCQVVENWMPKPLI